MTKQLNAIRMADAIRERLADFTVSDMFVRDAELSKNMHRVWGDKGDAGGLVSDLWVEGAFPSVPSQDTLNSLVAKGIVCTGLRDLLARNIDSEGKTVFPADRPLFKHQSESVREANTGYKQTVKPAIVVTAGTGAGKTESFLLPMLNDLFRHLPEEGQGVSAIILYPMNALVNDQVDRLYTWLKGQGDITLFNFTSETPEDNKDADDAGMPFWDVCRIRTRAEARMLEERYGESGKKLGKRNHVPRILVTNYSMLEYMLCRPQDNVFFGTNLRTLVLDEAHLYTGVLAAEITLLQRRLLLRCNLQSEDVLQFATSATLGSPGDLEPFAAKLFSKKKDVKVIVGEQKQPDLPPVNKASLPTLTDICSEKWPPQECDLLQTLGETQLVHALVDKLWQAKRIRLTELAQSLFHEAENGDEATRILLGLCASARKNKDAMPLMANRIHFLFRGAQGFTVFFDKRKRANSFSWNDLTVVPGYLERCPESGTYGLSLARCSECGEVFFHAIKDKGKGTLTAAPPLPRDEEDDEEEHTMPQEVFLADPQQVLDGESQMDCEFNPQNGHYTGVGVEAKGIQLCEIETCWHCKAGKRSFRAFVPSSTLIRNIAAETALAELPPEAVNPTVWLPGEGRRLLAFSDSRSSAAKLGPSLSRQHNRQVIRRLIVQEIPEIEPKRIARLQQQIKDLQTELSSDVDNETRSIIIDDIREKQHKLYELEAGGSVTQWLDKLKKSPLAAEVFDAEHSNKDDAKKWNKQIWEGHAQYICDEILPLRFMGELAMRPRWPQMALETLGLVEVVYPGVDGLTCPDSLSGLLPPELTGFMRKNWAAIVALMLDTLRTDGAVTFGRKEWDKHYNNDMPFIALGKWFSLEVSFAPWLIALKGKDDERHRRNAFVQTCIKRVMGANVDKIELARWTDLVFEHLFNQLHENAASGTFPWLESPEQQSGEISQDDALRINFSKLALRRPIALFRCAKTGQVWPRSVLGDAPARVRLDLKSVTSAKLDQDARLGRQRREYREAKIFEIGIWSEEHSAQLAPKENRRLQDLFKAGIRNLLSSTTTLELGIDIGGLNAVLMANLPPGKANYLQRAGRAGRRADGSSAVIGFARPMAYEQEVFYRFERFLDTPLRRPTVFLDREQIVVRHWNAYLLGEFFRMLPRAKTGAMTAYGRMGGFCNLITVPYWDRKLPKPKPNSRYEQQSALTQFTAFLESTKADNERLKRFDAARDTIRRECGTEGVLEGAMPDLLNTAKETFTDALKKWQEEYAEILEAWKRENVKKSFANKLYYQLKVLANMTVIETLANRRVLPRYGFPIDLHKLHIALSKKAKDAAEKKTENEVKEEGSDQFKLERKSLQALREYVPGSKLMAGNRTITSRGILKTSVGEHALGLHGKLAKCENGHSFYTITPELGKCPYCSARSIWPEKKLLLPRSGYQTAIWDEPEYRYEPRVVSFRCPIHVQLTTPTKTVNEFGGVPQLKADWFKDGAILAIHEGASRKGFAVCTACGYADSECTSNGEGRINLPIGFAEHCDLNVKKICWRDGTAPVLRHITLAAEQTTELLRLDFSPWLFRFGVPPHDATVAALAAALKLAGARLLEIDARELGMIEVFPTGNKGIGLGVLLYDDIPGGCGHVRDLLAQGEEWLKATQDLLYWSDTHHKACLHGCIDCILSAFSRENKIHPDRIEAYNFLNALIAKQSWQATPVDQESVAVQTSLPLTTATQSQNARLLKQKLNRVIGRKDMLPTDKKVYKDILKRLENDLLSEEQIERELASVQDMQDM